MGGALRYEDEIQPERDLMLVRREPGDVDEWKGLHIPESARPSQQIQGTVVSSGPHAPYGIGTRVVMYRGAGTVVALEEDKTEELAVIAPIDVQALVVAPLEAAS